MRGKYFDILIIGFKGREAFIDISHKWQFNSKRGERS